MRETYRHSSIFAWINFARPSYAGFSKKGSQFATVHTARLRVAFPLKCINKLI